MILITTPEATDVQIKELITKIKNLGIDVQIFNCCDYKVMVLMGDTSEIDPGILESHSIVEKILYVKEPFKKASKRGNCEKTIIRVGDELIGGKRLAIIAGPCSVESKEQIINIARAVKKSGANFLRGGAYKPRTSPYSFQGLEIEGLELLKIAREISGLPIVTEIMSTKLIDKFLRDVDVIQVGARNMQNYDLLKELGRTNKPVILKRGFAATIEELLMSAEYILAGGNPYVILCERGIRTFETYTRNTLDLSSIPVLKKLSHLPVIVDPSHATGKWWLVEPMAKAAVAAGADGLMIEVHNDPENAKSDGVQSIKPDRFDMLMKKIRAIAEIEGREI